MPNFLFSTSDRFPPFRVDVTVLFGDELASRGFNIDWILQSEDACEDSYQTTWKAGRAWVAKTNLGNSRYQRLLKHVYAIANSFKAISLGRSTQYDFYQSKDQFVLALPTLLAAKLKRRPFVYWLSYPFPEAAQYAAENKTARYPLLYRLKGAGYHFFLYRLLLPAAKHIFVQSEQMKRDIEQMGVPGNKMTPVPMGVSDTLVAEPVSTTSSHPVHVEKNSFLYLGTLIRERKLDFLIRVLEKVREQVPDAKLILVGDGEDPADAQFMRDEIARYQLEDAVTMTGFLPQEEALKYVQKAAVCVSPFYPTPILNSTSPTKVVEYMAMGKPVVANDHPEQQLVLSQSGAGLCTTYDETEFANAIVQLFSDTDSALAMGEKGRTWVLANRTYSRIADLVEAKYLEICNRDAEG